MKKKIVALLAAIAAVLGFGFASSTAMAADYGYTAAINGNVATVSYPAGTFAPNTDITVSFDDTYISDVVTVAYRTKVAGKSNADGSANLKFTLTDAALQAIAEGKTIHASVSDGIGLTSAEFSSKNVVQTGEGTPATGNKVPQTGASVAPYAVAVVLLAAAGCAVFAARKAGAR